jgi:formamidopyrimidine-DNA glycosylase
MPELPEVETVRSDLEKMVRDRPVIRRVTLLRGDVRFPIPPDLPKRLAGQPIIGVRRRAKYLLIDTPEVSLLSHLGMTGSWRLALPEAGQLPAPGKHDHCLIEFEDGRELIFRDPRRFGLLDLVPHGGELKHLRLKDLGVEPLDESAFTGEYLHRLSRKRKVAVKVFIMNQAIVVGVGNIYASEALYRAGISPSRAAARLSRADCDALVLAIRQVLCDAIAAGGSSIRDYRNLGGEGGGFQDLHLVYDRKGEPCHKCGAKIRAKVLGGRSTFWCPVCQK